jgi:acetyltransferase-like isoleucine patch superfamily enzyme
MAPEASPVTTILPNSKNIPVDAVAQVHESAVLGEGTIVRGEVFIGPEVKIGSNCIIEGAPFTKTVIAARSVLEDFVKVHPGVYVGEGSRVGSFSILGHPSKAVLAGKDNAVTVERVKRFLVPDPLTIVGPGALIRSHAVIYSHTVIGERFATGHFIMIREHTRIGERCVFGTHASVDGYACIGDRSHIGQYAQLSQSASIGRGVFIGGHTVLSDNDKVIADVNHDLYGAVVEDYVRIGLNSTLLPKVVIGRGALVGAGSLVSKEIPAAALAYGVPARVSRMLTDEEVQEYVESVER